jgi:hypothetical protein
LEVIGVDLGFEGCEAIGDCCVKYFAGAGFEFITQTIVELLLGSHLALEGDFDDGFDEGVVAIAQVCHGGG